MRTLSVKTVSASKFLGAMMDAVRKCGLREFTSADLMRYARVRPNDPHAIGFTMMSMSEICYITKVRTAGGRTFWRYSTAEEEFDAQLDRDQAEFEAAQRAEFEAGEIEPLPPFDPSDPMPTDEEVDEYLNATEI